MYIFYGKMESAIDIACLCVLGLWSLFRGNLVKVFVAVGGKLGWVGWTKLPCPAVGESS